MGSNVEVSCENLGWEQEYGYVPSLGECLIWLQRAPHGATCVYFTPPSLPRLVHKNSKILCPRPKLLSSSQPTNHHHHHHTLLPWPLSSSLLPLSSSALLHNPPPSSPTLLNPSLSPQSSPQPSSTPLINSSSNPYVNKIERRMSECPDVPTGNSTPNSRRPESSSPPPPPYTYTRRTNLSQDVRVKAFV